MSHQRIVRLLSVLLGLYLTVLGPSHGGPAGDGVPASVQRLRRTLRERMIDAERGLVLTRTEGDPLEDTSLYGGFYLGALVTAWRVTGDEATAQLARLVLSGLMLNASVGEPGFIARGVHPDRKRFRGNPSVDQYTGLLFGLWELHRSRLATGEEKRRIEQLYGEVLGRLKRDGYQITEVNGSKVTTFGRLAASRPTRAERLLSFLAAGGAITRQEQWAQEYERERSRRLSALTDFQRFESWVLIQSAASLRILSEIEQDPEPLAQVRRACREVADAAKPQASGFERFVNDPRPAAERLGDRELLLRGVRIPVEAVATVLLVGAPSQAAEAVPHLKRMLAELPFESFHDSRPLVSLEWAYWLAASRGLL